MARKRRRKQPHQAQQGQHHKGPNNEQKGKTEQRRTLEDDLRAQRQQRRQRKQRQGGKDDPRSRSNDSAATSIEDDLRRQRQRQSQRVEQRAAEVPSAATASADGNSPRLPQRRKSTGLPLPDMQEIVKCNTELRGQHIAMRPILRSHILSSLHSFHFAAGLQQACGSKRFSRMHRARMRKLWYGRYLLETLSVHRSPDFGTIVGGSRCLAEHTYGPSDLGPKCRLHPAARTLDVCTRSAGAQQRQSRWRQGQQPHTPRIVSARADDCMLYAAQQLPWQVPTSNQRIQCVRFGASLSNCVGMLLMQRHGRDRRQALRWIRDVQGPAPAISEFTLHEPVHDVGFTSNMGVLAPLKPYCRSHRRPIVLSLASAQIRGLDVRDFPTSDALRVEVHHEDNTIAFGHRNGALSVLDTRANTCQVIEPLNPQFGSVSDLQFRNRSDLDMMIVKRSFGVCQLLDLRKISSGDATHAQSSRRDNPSVVHTLQPTCSYDPTASASANGFAVVDSDDVLMSPFLNDEKDCCLGTWSLTTGHFLGQRVLRRHRANHRIFAELSRCVTPGYDVPRSDAGDHGNNSGTDSSDTVEQRPPAAERSGGCGIWMKLGSVAPTNEPEFNRDCLYHLHLPNRWYDPDTGM